MGALVTQSCLMLCDSRDCSLPPLSMEFSRQEYRSGLPFPSPEDLPNPGTEFVSPVLAGGFFTTDLEKEMTTHSSVLNWRIPGTGEPGGLPSMGSHRVRHD